MDSQSPGGSRVGWDTPLATVVWFDWLPRGCGVQDDVTRSGLSEGLHSRGWALSRLAGAGLAGMSCLRFVRATAFRFMFVLCHPRLPGTFHYIHLQGELRKEAQSGKEKPLRRDRGAGGLWSRKRWRPKGCAAAGGFSVTGRQPGRLGYSAGDGGLVGLVAPGLRGRGQCDGQRFVRRVAFSWVGSQSARRRGLGWDVLPALCARRGFSIHACFVSSPPARYIPLHLQGELQKEAQSRKEKPLRRDRGAGGLWSRKRWRPKGCAAAGGFSVTGRQPGRLGYSAGDGGLVGLVAPGLRGRGQCDGQRFVRRVAFSWVGSQSARRRGLGWDVLPALCVRRGFSIHACFVSSPPARYIPLHLQGELQKEAQSRKEKPLRRDRGAGGLWSRTE